MKKYAIGLMSGTSLDGIDAALVSIEGFGTNTDVNLEAFHTFPLKDDIKEKIYKCLSLNDSNVQLICQLNFQLGYEFAKACFSVCQKADISIDEVDFIASHGQTLYHEPFGALPSTLQIGEATIIAYETNTKVVSNFRPMDMAAGGQGAPLVPYTEYILFGSGKKNVGLQNFGGIGNITVILANGNSNDIFAFDTGPGNMIIDELMRVFYNKSYDEKGYVAKTGSVDERLLSYMLSHPFLLVPPPKSTGREEFGLEYTKELLNKYSDIKPNDFIATATMFTAKSLALSYKNYIQPNAALEEIIVSGGGAYNTTLINYIKKLLPEIDIKTQEDIGFSSEAKEAIAFAILGNETLNNVANNLPSATGAKRPVILGTITPKPF